MASSPVNPPSPEREPPAAEDVGGAPSAETRDSGRPARVIRYGAMGWVGEFAQKPGVTLAPGTKVVVQTDRGIELGEPVGVACATCGKVDVLVPRGPLQSYVRNSGQEFCRPRAGRILRIATEQDCNEHAHLNAHLREDIDTCAEIAETLRLDIKIITAEHLLGGERIVFYFSAPARVDFRQLVRELAQRYRTRIEMRQVKARDEARLVADYEVCGRECCCKNFLKKLRPVNMKMAKLQKSTLDPSKVSGRCGRLRCCLRYENTGYEELAARLPRLGTRVRTEFGIGTVIEQQILTQLLLLRMDDNARTVAVPVEELLELNLPPAAREPGPGGAAPAWVDEDALRGRRRRDRNGVDRAGQRDGPSEPAPPRDDRPESPPGIPLPTLGPATEPPDADDLEQPESDAGFVAEESTPPEPPRVEGSVSPSGVVPHRRRRGRRRRRRPPMPPGSGAAG